MIVEADQALDRTFGALSDRHRRAILARLAKGPATVNEIAEPFEISLPAVSRHLKVLEAAGLISRTREAQWRRCALIPDKLHEADTWIAGYRRFWGETFDRLEVFVRGANKALWHKWQVAPNDGWSNWSSLGGWIDRIAVGNRTIP